MQQGLGGGGRRDGDDDDEFEYDGSGRPPIPKRPTIPERPDDEPGSADEDDLDEWMEWVVDDSPAPAGKKRKYAEA